MKINRDFTIQKVGSTYVAVPVGKTSKHFHNMIQLNETAAFIWKTMAERDSTEEELVDAILGEYEIDRETAARDVHRVVTLLAENGILV